MRGYFYTVFLGVLVSFLFAQPASAQMLQIAICEEGGCTCHVTGQTIADFEMTMGIAAPKGAADMTLVTRDGEYYWSRKTPAQIDSANGGLGSCPIQLAAPLIPEDGQWRIDVGTTDTSACPLFRLTGQTLPAQISGGTRQIQWGGRFSPDKLMSEARGMVDWTHSGNHDWRGVVTSERLSNRSDTTGASVIWNLQLVSATEVKGTSTFDFDISSGNADAAALAILSQMQCRTTTPFTARKVG